ncbi:MAG: 3-deoxy-D-manno-octulosonic acid transferase [Rhizobacter sp.]
MTRAAAPVRERLASVGYGALLAALAPAYVLRLWWRGRAEPLYREAIGERFGRYEGQARPGCLWLHAVSLGETRAATALVDALRRLRPGVRLLLTHGTATGREAGRALLREGDEQAWLPFDSRAAVRRFLRHFRPAVGVLMETEIWPNLLREADAAGVPMVLANARLSARSQRKGERFGALLRPAVRRLRLVLAQSEDDARRLQEVGAPTVVVSGNLKFEITPDPAQLARGRAWRTAIGRDVVLAAVTREGEEEVLLEAWARRAAPRPLLLVVPRHPQRFDAVAALVGNAGLVLARRSTWADAPPADAAAADVWLGDSIGEMALYYGASRLALLGGSFAPLGGQNLIEAAACGCPILLGPHTFNFAEAAELSLAAGAALRLPTLEAAVDRALALLHGGELDAMQAAALAFSARHRGAAERMAARILELMGS